MLSVKILCPSHSIFFLPPEIMSIILANIEGYLVENLETLMLVSRWFRDYMKIVVKYVDRLILNKGCSILDLFTGVKHLEILRYEYKNRSTIIPSLDFASFSMNIWRNIKILIIPYNIAGMLDESYTENTGMLDESYTENTTDKFKNTTDKFKNVRRNSTILDTDNTGNTSLLRKSKFFMPNLQYLTMFGQASDEYKKLYINPEILPSLRNVKLSRCVLDNLDEFKTLEILKISHIDFMNIYLLNKLNISELSLEDVDCDEPLDINIPSLRKLEIVDGFLMMNSINNLNISELMLKNVEYCDNTILNIPTLRKLVIIRGYLDECFGTRDINNHNLTELILLDVECSYDYPILNIPTLRKLVLNASNINIGELQSLERLVINDSCLSVRNPRMIKLTSLDIVLPRNLCINLAINRLNFPNLRYLNTFGFGRIFNDEEMLKTKSQTNIIITHNPVPTFFRYASSKINIYGVWNYVRIKNKITDEHIKLMMR